MSADTHNFYPALKRTTTPTTSGSRVVAYSSDLGPDRPILTLIHGYPQSSLIWRHVVPGLIDQVSLFIPELPGYGISSAPDRHSKLDVGRALLEALRDAFQVGPGAGRRVVVLGGHDRGARVAHRLAVSRDSEFGDGLRLGGVVLLDIVPTAAQWAAFADPAVSRGYFHWPLLANVALAVPMLAAYGGGRWCRGCHELIAGSNEAGRARIAADGAVDTHAALFEREDVLRATCEDYAAGSSEDVMEQVADQAAGRKLAVPTLVMFSAEKLGARLDVAGIWREWVADGVAYDHVAVGEGYGHYLPEEASGVVVESMIKFLKRESE